MSQSFPEEPVFPVLPQLSRRGSTHTMLALGTALWECRVESLVGKPRRKAGDPLIDRMGSLRLVLLLRGKAHVDASTRDED